MVRSHTLSSRPPSKHPGPRRLGLKSLYRAPRLSSDEDFYAQEVVSDRLKRWGTLAATRSSLCSHHGIGMSRTALLHRHIIPALLLRTVWAVGVAVVAETAHPPAQHAANIVGHTARAIDSRYHNGDNELASLYICVAFSNASVDTRVELTYRLSSVLFEPVLPASSWTPRSMARVYRTAFGA
jgi:hypothetical protein